MSRSPTRRVRRGHLGVWLSVGVVVVATGAAIPGGATGFAASTEVVAPIAGVSGLALDPRSPDIVYAGAQDGVYRSVDGGTSWQRSASEPVGVVRFVSVAPTRPSTVYAISIENAQPGRSRLQGIWRSRDGGDRFEHVPGVDPGWPPRAVAFAAGAPNTLYVSTELFFARPRHVPLYRSLDGGKHWTAAARGLLADAAVWSLAVDPFSPRTVYAANAAGLWRSDDRGDTWTPRWPKKDERVAEVAIDPVAPETLYAAAPAAVFKSSDGGASWRRLGLRLAKQEVATEIVVDRKDHRVVYAATFNLQGLPGRHGVYKSTNSGRSWTQILRGSVIGKAGAGDVNQFTSLVVDPERPRLLVSTFAGVWRSLDAGRTWHRADNGFGE